MYFSPIAVIHLTGENGSFQNASMPPAGNSARARQWRVCQRALHHLHANLRFSQPDMFLGADEAHIIQEQLPNVAASMINIVSRLEDESMKVRSPPYR